MQDSYTVNGDLPLLGVQGISTAGGLIVQVRCPSGLSVLSADDAQDFANSILRELSRLGHESKWLRHFKKQLDDAIANTTDEELKSYFGPMYEEIGHSI